MLCNRQSLQHVVRKEQHWYSLEQSMAGSSRLEVNERNLMQSLICPIRDCMHKTAAQSFAGLQAAESIDVQIFGKDNCSEAAAVFAHAVKFDIQAAVPLLQMSSLTSHRECGRRHPRGISTLASWHSKLRRPGRGFFRGTNCQRHCRQRSRISSAM